MATFLTTPEVITPGGTTGWQTVDVSSLVRVDTVGIIIHAINSDSGSQRDAGWRKTGSSDDIFNFLFFSSHTWGVIGVNGSKQVDLYRDNSAISYRLHGYFTEGEAHFLTNAFDPALPAVNGYQNVDISSIVQGGHTPIAACLDIETGTGGAAVFSRHGDSTDDRRKSLARKTGFIVGVNSSNIFEFHNGNGATRRALVVGYLFDKAVFPANSPGNRAPTADSTWRNLTAALPSGAVGGAYHVFDDGLDGDANYGLRESGTSDNVVHGTLRFHGFGALKCNASRQVQANLQTSDQGVWQLGHFEASPELDNGGEGAGVMIRGGLSGGFQ